MFYLSDIAASMPLMARGIRLRAVLAMSAAVLLGFGGMRPAAAEPTINDDFTASMTIDVGTVTGVSSANLDLGSYNWSGPASAATVLQLLDQSSTIDVASNLDSTATEQVYMGYSTGALRIDFFSSASGSPVLTSRIVQDPYAAPAGLFDWVANATASGTCSWNGKPGVQWVYFPTGGDISVMDMCANGNVPLDVTYALTNDQAIQVTFNTFTPGTPDASVFDVPDVNVPEPASALILAAGVLAMVGARRGQRV